MTYHRGGVHGGKVHHKNTASQSRQSALFLRCLFHQPTEEVILKNNLRMETEQDHQNVPICHVQNSFGALLSAVWGVSWQFWYWTERWWEIEQQLWMLGKFWWCLGNDWHTYGFKKLGKRLIIIPPVDTARVKSIFKLNHSAFLPMNRVGQISGICKNWLCAYTKGDQQTRDWSYGILPAWRYQQQRLLPSLQNKWGSFFPWISRTHHGKYREEHHQMRRQSHRGSHHTTPQDFW